MEYKFLRLHQGLYIYNFIYSVHEPTKSLTVTYMFKDKVYMYDYSMDMS